MALGVIDGIDVMPGISRPPMRAADSSPKTHHPQNVISNIIKVILCFIFIGHQPSVT